MKKSILAVFAASAALALLACSGSSNSTDEEQIATFKTKPLTFIDERDGKTYRYVKIGTQTWMAENLNYAVPLTNEAGSTAIDAEVGSVCYDNKESNCDKYGRLYYWVTAAGLPADCKSNYCNIPKTTSQRQGICPAGWHLPDSLEFQTLLNYAGIKVDQVYGSKLGTKLMSESIGGTDKYGFNALFGGYHVHDNGKFFSIDTVGWWWTTDEWDPSWAYTLKIRGNKVEISAYLKTTILSSVRCVQDDPSLPLIQATSSSSVEATPSSSSISSSSAVPKPTLTNTFTDARDGKKYGYVEIGDQTWMAENLNYAVDFSESGSNAYDSKCYMNDESNCDIYGRLYTWGAAINSLCPSDWHLPSDAEWTKLTDFVGTNVASKLKAKIGWDSSGNGTDAYGFAALPNGIGRAGVGFEMIGKATFFWTSTEDDWHNSVFNRGMSYSSDSVSRNYAYKNNYFSVRCVKDAAKPSSSSAAKTPSSSSANVVLENGVEKTLFTDERDGKIYKSVKIGKQTWMAENLNYAAEGRMCYEDCTVYGGIYYWATAMDLLNTYNTLSYTASAKHQGICPAGWHIPSDAEWTTLTNFVGDNAGIKLKAKKGWNSYNGISGNGNDMYGFAALPGGRGSGRNLNNQGDYASWLSTTEVVNEYVNGSHAYNWTMWYNNDNFIQSNHIKNYYAFSVRCVKDTEE